MFSFFSVFCDKSNCWEKHIVWCPCSCTRHSNLKPHLLDQTPFDVRSNVEGRMGAVQEGILVSECVSFGLCG